VDLLKSVQYKADENQDCCPEKKVTEVTHP
jgi:hypothetical protein